MRGPWQFYLLSSAKDVRLKLSSVTPSLLTMYSENNHVTCELFYTIFILFTRIFCMQCTAKSTLLLNKTQTGWVISI